jgi:hypothetical protein
MTARTVDRVAALARPVDVAQVEDERELVEDERGAYAEENRREGAYCRVCAGARGDDQAGNEHEHDAHDLVVEVDAPDAAASPAALARHARVAAGAAEGDQEREQQQEEWFFSLVEDDAAVPRYEAEEIHEAGRRLPRGRAHLSAEAWSNLR